MERLWTTSEAASFLGISEGEIERLVKAGTLTGYKLGGRFLRFRPEQVEALKGRVNAQPAASDTVALTDSLAVRLSEFFYFYDFYLISGVCLVALIGYVVWSAR